MDISIFGTGQVGLAWAKAIRELPGAQLDLYDPVPSSTAVDWATAQGMEIRPSLTSGLEQQIILLCVPGAVVPQLIPELIEHAGNGSQIVDLSTAGSLAKRESEHSASMAGLAYIDAAITGAVGIHGAATPLLVAGTPSAAVLSLFQAVGAPATILPESKPGDAVSVKLLRSVIMKGLEALAVETLPAAQDLGVLDALLDSLADVDRASFRDLITTMATTHPQQAYRRHGEVLEAIKQLDSAGAEHPVSNAVALAYADTKQQAELRGLPTDPSLETTLKWYQQGISTTRNDLVQS